LADNSKTFRLPTYLHERLIAIRGAKYALEDQGIAPTIEVRRLYIDGILASFVPPSFCKFTMLL